MHQLIQGDCLDVLQSIDRVTTLLADPPDNIGLRYNAYRDCCPDTDYIDLLRKWLHAFVEKAKTVWFSYNSRWTFHVGRIVTELEDRYGKLIEAKPCVQTFTFGQHNHNDLVNNHRPLLRLRWRGTGGYTKVDEG